MSVTTGLACFLIAGTAWHFTDTATHPWPARLAAATGLLLVGLIHARTWRDPDPWGKRTRNA